MIYFMGKLGKISSCEISCNVLGDVALIFFAVDVGLRVVAGSSIVCLVFVVVVHIILKGVVLAVVFRCCN